LSLAEENGSMSTEKVTPFSSLQAFALIALRTLIGWHFLYEAYYKITSPAWSASGGPLTPWTSAGYLRGASGPLAGLFQRMLNAGLTPWIDRGVKVALLLIGLSLILGLFSRIGAAGALFFLSLFYLLYVPTLGVPQPNAEGTYLIVNKTLIEAAAVTVLLVFDTGKIAGFDLLWNRRSKQSREEARVRQEPTEAVATLSTAGADKN
jgi:thiosulfate dehydrogenase [quinone] large subunit